jgi:RsiW-degrading membrane proteinase PrsW (M82 family)
MIWFLRIRDVSNRRTDAGMTPRNLLYLVVGALIVVVAVLGYQVYQDRKKPDGVQVNIGSGGLSIEKK